MNRLQTVLRRAELGDPRIIVHDVEAQHAGSRLTGAPCDEPFRLRVVRRETFSRHGTQTVPIDKLRTHIPQDLTADIGGLLASGRHSTLDLWRLETSR